MNPQNCPWCGKETRLSDSGAYYWVRCLTYDCAATGPTRPTEEEAITVWNQIELKEIEKEKPTYLPCPHCCGTLLSPCGAFIARSIWCAGCGLSGPSGENADEAVQLWNTLPRR